MLGRLRDLLIDGLLLMLPVAVVFVLLRHVVDAIARLLQPVAQRLPQAGWFGLAAVDLLALALLVAGLVAVGAFARTPPGRRMAASIETLVLRKIPGFLLFKSVLAGFSSEERQTVLLPALIALDDNTVLGFVVEPAGPEDEMVTVFVPAAPTPAAGSVLLVERSRVRLLDVPVAQAMQTVTKLGLGLRAIRPVRSGQ